MLSVFSLCPFGRASWCSSLLVGDRYAWNGGFPPPSGDGFPPPSVEHALALHGFGVDTPQPAAVTSPSVWPGGCRGTPWRAAQLRVGIPRCAVAPVCATSAARGIPVGFGVRTIDSACSRPCAVSAHTVLRRVAPRLGVAGAVISWCAAGTNRACSDDCSGATTEGDSRPQLRSRAGVLVSIRPLVPCRWPVGDAFGWTMLGAIHDVAHGVFWSFIESAACEGLWANH